MLFACDRTQFPLVRLTNPQIEVHLLPLTKVQFEQFLAETARFGDGWYEQLLSLNSRVSWRCFSDLQRERLFLTGILPEELSEFARWLGAGFDLPTVDEWRSACEALGCVSADRLEEVLPLLCEPARVILQKLHHQWSPSTLAEIGLFRYGVVEWVRDDHRWVGLGSPRSDFHSNLWNPLETLVVPTQYPDRLHFFGGRLVRRLAQGTKSSRRSS